MKKESNNALVEITLPTRLLSFAVVGLLLLLSVNSFADPVPVTVKLVDQDGVEHKTGVIRISHTVAVYSGEILDMEPGEHLFTLRPAIYNVTQDEDRAWHVMGLGSVLQRHEWRTVPNEPVEFVFVWNRAVWSPFVLEDQNGDKHSTAALQAHGGSSGTLGRTGDMLRIPVTDYTDDEGIWKDGYFWRLQPTWSNLDTGGEGTIGWLYMGKLINLPVSLETGGTFRWNRTCGQLSLFENGVPGPPAYLKIYHGLIPGRGDWSFLFPVTEGLGIRAMNVDDFARYFFSVKLGSQYFSKNIRIDEDGFLQVVTVAVEHDQGQGNNQSQGNKKGRGKAAVETTTWGAIKKLMK